MQQLKNELKQSKDQLLDERQAREAARSALSEAEALVALVTR